MTTRTLVFALAFAPFALATAACNTVDGAGDDLKSASRDVREEINN